MFAVKPRDSFMAEVIAILVIGGCVSHQASCTWPSAGIAVRRWRSARVAVEDIYDERLYRALDRLLPHKEIIDKHLVKRLKTFYLDYDLLLYM